MPNGCVYSSRDTILISSAHVNFNSLVVVTTNPKVVEAAILVYRATLVV